MNTDLMLDFSSRATEPERMDTAFIEESELKKCLAFLQVSNHVFGGYLIIHKYLKRFLADHPKNVPVRILDVGCGLGDIPVRVVNWARFAGYHLKICGLELISQTALMAKHYARNFPEIEIQEGDIFKLDVDEKSYDYVISSLFFHHVSDSQLNSLIWKLDKIATKGIIISDLHRCRSGYWAVKLLSRLIGCKTVQHDGPLSVLRAFRIQELDKLAERCGLTYLKAGTEPFFRISLAGQKI